MLPKLIALSGHKGCGKDTIGMFLMNNHGYRPISFAYELKNMVSKMYNIPREWMDDRDKKDMPLTNFPVIPTDRFALSIQHMLIDEIKSGFWTPRALLILEGSIKRSVYSNYWVKKVVNQITNDPTNNYVITDMRYCNEADTLKLMVPSSLAVRVERKNHVITTSDPSERDLDNYGFDVYLYNDGSLTDLEKFVNNFIEGCHDIG